MKNRRMRTRMYGGVRGRKTKKVGRNSKIFVFLLLDCVQVWRVGLILIEGCSIVPEKLQCFWETMRGLKGLGQFPCIVSKKEPVSSETKFCLRKICMLRLFSCRFFCIFAGSKVKNVRI